MTNLTEKLEEIIEKIKTDNMTTVFLTYDAEVLSATMFRTKNTSISFRILTQRILQK